MQSISGHELKEAFAAAARSLERFRDLINSLNVFPVPDGDTGTNMLLTMRAGVARCTGAADATAAEVTGELADGAFWGACGNSGVILSQFLKGFAEALAETDSCAGQDLGRGLLLATQASYSSVGQPVEGTMLSVMRGASEAVSASLQKHEDSALSLSVLGLWETALTAAKEALALTPSQLPVLREAGVVDAGGMGVVALLGGVYAQLAGLDGAQMESLVSDDRFRTPEGFVPAADAEYLEATTEYHWGYCTQFVIEGEELDLEEIRRALVDEASGSDVIVGNRERVRVHFHTDNPGPALTYGVSLGQLSQINIQNMSHQNQEFSAEQRQSQPIIPGTAVVAVASGEGLEQLFRDAGCAQVVSGGQTMNPSVKRLMDAVEAAGVSEVIVLPNNKNIILAAQQAAAGASAGRKAYVVPSRTMPQGVAALLAFNAKEPLEKNLEQMNRALESVATVEVTRAVRSTSIEGVPVGEGQFMALADGDLTYVGDTPESVLRSALEKIGLSPDAVVTLFWGADVTEDQACAEAAALEADHEGIQVDVAFGGQPHYHYLASVE